ncbi:MAG: S-adenosylmethionine decarboxylase, partial [Pedobacter sp.]
TESHLSIHTWPEFKLATFDIFLSNYQKDNTQKVKKIYKSVLAFFDGKELQKNEIVR